MKMKEYLTIREILENYTDELDVIFWNRPGKDDQEKKAKLIESINFLIKNIE